MTVGEYMLFYPSVEKELATRLVGSLKSLDEMVAMCGCAVPRKCFLRVYRLFPKIETIPESDKKEFWEWARTNFPGKSKAELIENCKIVYTAGELLNEKKINL